MKITIDMGKVKAKGSELWGKYGIWIEKAAGFATIAGISKAVGANPPSASTFFAPKPAPVKPEEINVPDNARAEAIKRIYYASLKSSIDSNKVKGAMQIYELIIDPNCDDETTRFGITLLGWLAGHCSLASSRTSISDYISKVIKEKEKHEN